MTTKKRVLVVGTTPDYIHIIDRRWPGRALFLTHTSFRIAATEPPPSDRAEALCDLGDTEAAKQALDCLVQDLQCGLSGIACYDCESLPLAAELADRLGLPFPGRSSVAAARSKAEMKRLWRAAGMACPKAQTVGSPTEAAEWFEALGGPVVLKPLSGSGSELVFLCRTREETERASAELMARLAKHADTRMYATSDAREAFLAEEYIEGVELSCDFVVSQGEAQIVRVARKIARPGDFATTLAYAVPGELPAGLERDGLTACLLRAAEALGIYRALCMADIIVRDGRPYLIEMSPRPGGDCLPDVLMASSGFDIIGAELDLAEGREVSVPSCDVWRPTVGLRIFADRAGRLVRVDLSAIKTDPRVVRTHLKHTPGHEITLPPDDYDSRILGHILFHPTPTEDLTEQCSELLSRMVVDVREATNAPCPELPTPELDGAVLKAFVGGVLSKRSRYLDATHEWGSPLYILERDVLLDRAAAFRGAFEGALPGSGFYYALKSNNCPDLARILVGAGWGLDVSSGLELTTALACGASDIVFSGPGKRDDELMAAARLQGRVTLLVDSFGELERLSRIAHGLGMRVRAGVRVMVSNRGLWRKFGLPIDAIPSFLDRAEKLGAVDVSGLQFHSSWNMGPENQAGYIEQIGVLLSGLPERQRERIEFLDIGGGFWPPAGEWLHATSTDEGRAAGLGDYDPGPTPHHCAPAAPIGHFAARLAEAVNTHIRPHSSCRICLEPGRWICHDAMQILLTVVDKKADDLVITDAGTNAVGWERYETDYFPVVNLTRPGTQERACYVLGSLCTPHDVWGYTYHGVGIEPGDVLLVPSQGAYTYSLRQQFIKPLPRLVVL